ncbi:MAG: hypothetical protein UT32_C0013G0021 [Parcubacteria group bacterium GW2011_GWC2_39_14]|nr:MAG: hypothetical protein UT32_C0013G0021 [Parcubacteria group bacterium GW2011_GWC2_39_14]KKR54509.1 MAG: hypothetical protein UT91_C0014G0021 [Parcubacteria group bacterium GW2011_GWA2_40_23]
MKIIQINVQEPYFSYILSGAKSVEGRLNKGKFQEAEVGDVLEINEVSNYKIVGKRVYKTFAEMIEKEGVKKVIPGASSVEMAVSVYYQFYTKEQEKEFGVVAIEIEKV